MSPILVEIGLALLGLLPIAALLRQRERRAASGDPRHGAWLWGAAIAQLLGGLSLLGAAHGIAVVAGGWMALGGPFVACLNANRARTLAAARWIGFLGGACLVAGLLARAF